MLYTESRMYIFPFLKYLLHGQNNWFSASPNFCPLISDVYIFMTHKKLYCKVINVISDERSATICPLTLKESEITAGDCVGLEVHAEQYGVQSQMKFVDVCYDGKAIPLASLICISNDHQKCRF